MRYFIRLSVALAERHDSVEAIILDNMIVRLYELLTENAKVALLADLDTSCGTPILYWLATKVKGSRRKYSVYNLDDLSKAFSDLQGHPTMCNWKRLVRDSVLIIFKLLYYLEQVHEQSFLYMTGAAYICDAGSRL